MNRTVLTLVLALGAGVAFTANAAPQDEGNGTVDECRAISGLSKAGDDRYASACLEEIQRMEDDAGVTQNPTEADPVDRCSRLVNQESLSEADRKLYLNACVTELQTAQID